MSGTPIFSTITLATEILVTVSVLYIFYRGYKYGRLPRKLVGLTLGYEIIVNISYMAFRAATETGEKMVRNSNGLRTGLAIFHGAFSLIMFTGLLAFMAVAYKKYNRGENFFREHERLSAWFLGLWMVAVTSGILFYFVEYFG